MNSDVHFLFDLAHFFLEWEMFQAKVVDKIKTHILFLIAPLSPPSFFLIVLFVI